MERAAGQRASSSIISPRSVNLIASDAFSVTMREDAFLECLVERVRGDTVLKEAVFSLILFGSYVRGDYMPGVSDLDICAVLRGESAADALRRAVDECVRSTGYDGAVDLAWCTVEEMRNPLAGGYPFKFLTVYLEDFRKHHRVIYGEEIAGLLPEKPPGDTLRWRAKRLRELAEERKGDERMLSIVAGEAVRLLALLHGATGISKGEVEKALDAVSEESLRALARSVWSAYLSGRTVSPEVALRTVGEITGLVLEGW